ncbi:hypothetical protein HK101_009362, partial [Irineochytrium annulatum]
MKCHLCTNWIEIHTDPKNAQYELVSGARKREEDFSPEDAGTIEVNDEGKVMDPMEKLEHVQADARRAYESKSLIEDLQELNDKQWSDPFLLSQQMRRKFRVKEEKKIREASRLESAEIRDKHNLMIDILPASADDAVKAKLVEYSSLEIKPEDQIKIAVDDRPIFVKKPKAVAPKKPAAKTKSLRDLIASEKRVNPFGVLGGKGAVQQRGGPSVTVPKPKPKSATIMITYASGDEG